MAMKRNQPEKIDRRKFLKSSSAAVIGTTFVNVGIPSRSFASDASTLKVGLIGCGGRGTGAAAQALTSRLECFTYGDGRRL